MQKWPALQTQITPLADRDEYIKTIAEDATLGCDFLAIFSVRGEKKRTTTVAGVPQTRINTSDSISCDLTVQAVYDISIIGNIRFKNSRIPDST